MGGKGVVNILIVVALALSLVPGHSLGTTDCSFASSIDDT